MRTGDRLRQVAIERFAAQGFQATGIRDLAKHTGLSVASLYQHMATKEDLLAEIMTESLQQLTADADALLAQVHDPLDRIAGLTTVHVFAHALTRERTLVVDTEMRSLGPAARDQVIVLRDAYERRWSDVLEAAAAQELISATHLGMARLAILDMLTGVATWFRPNGPATIEEVAQTHVDFVLALLDARRRRRKVRHKQCNYPEAAWFQGLRRGT